MTGRWVLIAVLATAATGCGPRPEGGVQGIVIDSAWTGLSFEPVPATRVVIRNQDGVYMRDGDPIAPSSVDALVSAMTARVARTPTLSSLGITKAWLDARVNGVADSLRQFQIAPERTAPNQKALFKATFTRPDAVAALLDDLFECGHTDDYPSIMVTVSFANGAERTAESSSQCALMLPWQVEGRLLRSFNANLPLAVAALMPRGSTNLGRLSDDQLAAEVADRVMGSIEGQLDLLDIEARAPGVLERLRSRYVVERAEINQYHSTTFGTEWDLPPEQRETNLHATLRRARLRDRIATELVLQLEPGRAPDVDRFLTAAAEYEKRALAVPWLRTYMKNGSIELRIEYVHHQSLGDKALRIFTADMTALNKRSVAAEVAEDGARAVLLYLVPRGQFSTWVLLSDNRMILWRQFGGAPAGVEWESGGPRGGPCSAYSDPGWTCVGAIVTPEGAVQR